jgi:hypothetical protein
MELTPSERVRLNSAIVRSTRTGQPLSPELQAMYDRAAMAKNSPFKTRNVSDILFNRTVDTSGGLSLGPRGAVEIVPHSGPASSLPVTDFDELYPKEVPSLGEGSFRRPFNREFEFPVDTVTKNTESVYDRSKRFMNQYFEGKNPGFVINPATGSPYGNELKIHDAMHDYANVGNTLRGEELITIAENVGATPLRAAGVNLTGLTQQLTPSDLQIYGPQASFISPADAYDSAVPAAKAKARMSGPTLVQQRGAARGSSLFRDANNVGSFLSPPISETEFNTMAQRGQEFYDQVHQNWNQFKQKGNFGGPVEWSDANNREGNIVRAKAAIDFLGADWTQKYGKESARQMVPKALSQKITGGYNTGGLPYGNPLSLMNAPLVPTVDRNLWQKELNKISESGIPNVQELITKEQQMYESPEQVELRQLPGKPSIHKTAPVAAAVEGLAGLWGIAKDENYLKTINKPENIKEALLYAVNQARNSTDTGARAGVPDKIHNDRVYLNPPNLGSQVKEGVRFSSTSQSGKTLLQASKIDPEDALLTAAAKAKQIEGYNKAFPEIKQAIRTGFNATTDLAGSVPLFDPVFRQAVEQGNVGKAARQVATEYVAGTLAAPVVGAGMGVFQRVAPQAARVATGALGVARTANPIAVTSQIGGSSRINPQADKAAIQSQFQRAEAARKRGGRWKFPTPFGQFTVPELGISEAKGLFFR